MNEMTARTQDNAWRILMAASHKWPLRQADDDGQDRSYPQAFPYSGVEILQLA
jgi:hypothetical protein